MLLFIRSSVLRRSVIRHSHSSDEYIGKLILPVGEHIWESRPPKMLKVNNYFDVFYNKIIWQYL
jgi:hypothetical protein